MVEFLSVATDHEASYIRGTRILGPEADSFRSDNKAAEINAVRIRGLFNQIAIEGFEEIMIDFPVFLNTNDGTCSEVFDEHMKG